ncbi:FAD:protein FMN transferase [Clostridium perfringens]|uniref:FAD:protein FMN transferase n=1 Tax=Clostridium perfringens TaxID=1502 RepID=UPI002AC45502|nr:FAD:protein FMN transferase [Clostridium perfringens]MDZ5130777.1 FAD:protein FMN transferase [Clostridium perfringens]
MENLRHICIFLCMVLTFTLNGCSIKKEPISKSSFFMGTIVNITLYDKFDEGIIDKAFNKISEIESLLSLNIQNSEINKINEKSGIEPVKVTKTTFDIIEKSLEYSKASKGNFDITIGPLVKLWGIGSEDARVPDDSEILDTIKLINYENIILDKENTTVFLKEENMVLDLGAIAKGYIADLISDILIEEGVSKAIIDLGGNIFALGEKNKNENWTIGIQNPFENRGAPLGTLSICNKSVVTSGIYERYLEINNTKYHHILNPKIGYPYDNNLASVTIVSSKSIDGDALSTSTFGMGLSDGLELIESLPEIEGIFVTKSKEIFISKGLKNNFKLLDNSFKIAN